MTDPVGSKPCIPHLLWNTCKVPFIYYVSTFKLGGRGVKDAKKSPKSAPKVPKKCQNEPKKCPKVFKGVQKWPKKRPKRSKNMLT